MKKMLKIYFSDWKIWFYIITMLFLLYLIITHHLFSKYYWTGFIVIIIAPFYEWIVHKYILHFRVGKIHSIPLESTRKKYYYGDTITFKSEGENLSGKIIAVENDHIKIGTGLVKHFPIVYHLMQDLHYGHHKNPNDIKYVIAPLWGGLFVIGQQFLIAYVISGFNWKPSIVYAWFSGIYYLYYEWTHLAHHIPEYTPLGSLNKKMKELHSHHHFINENLWWGITNPLGDMILGTNKSKERAEKSPYTHDINSDTHQTLTHS